MRKNSSLTLCLLPLLVLLSLVAAKETTKLVVHMASSGARFPASLGGDWARSPAALTHVGMRQLYLMGRDLRKQYVEGGLLSERYSPAELMLRASANKSAATCMSAYALARGLYLPGTGYSLNDKEIKRAVPPNDNFNYTSAQKELRDAALPNYFSTVAVTMYNGEADYVLDAATVCPNVQSMVDAYRDDNSTLQSRENSLEAVYKKGIYAELSKAFKTEVGNMSEALRYRDLLLSAKHYAKDLGVTISKEGMGQLDQIYALVEYEEFYGSLDVARTVAHGMLGEISDQLKKLRENSPKRKKMVSYVIPETNILAVLRLLSHNVSTGYVQVPYASSFVVEVFSEDATPVEYKARMKFNGIVYPWPTGENEVSLDRLSNWTVEMQLKDFDSFCDAKKSAKKLNDTPWLVAGMVVCGLIVLMIVMTCVYILKKHNGDDTDHRNSVEDLHDDEIKIIP